ncbi:MAG: ATP-binding protein, partial [Thermoplasmata archaeon]
TVLIAGESGVGKTRLAEEIIAIAEHSQFQIFRAQCFLESLAPYTPFSAVLKDAGLEHLLTETKPPKLEGIYVVNKGGIILGKLERKETLDSDIFMGMVNAVETFVKDSLAQIQKGTISEQIGHMGYGSFFITNVPGKLINLVAVTTGRENEYLISDMREILVKLEKAHGEAIGRKAEEQNVIEEEIRKLFSSGKYEGIEYAEEDAALRQVNLFENVARGIQRKAEEKPVLIFIDDLQWSDPSSLAMLHYLARNTRKSRVMILCAYRPEDTIARYDGGVHQLVSAMEKMAKEELFEKVVLSRMDVESCSVLISDVLGAKIEAEFTEWLYRETEGNTLFLIEILKHLYETGELRFERGKWVYNLETMRLPARVYEVITRRLERLNKEEREVLDGACVLGVEFTSVLLSKVIEKPRSQVVRTLVNIERMHTLIKALKDRYRFEHSKIREVLYQELLEEMKAIYHENAGKALEEDYKQGRLEVLEEMVYHYAKAGMHPKVIEYGLVAGKLAKKRFANEEAVRVLRAVLEAMGEGEQYMELKLEVQEELADVLELAGRYDEAIEKLKERIGCVNALEAGKDYAR